MKWNAGELEEVGARNELPSRPTTAPYRTRTTTTYHVDTSSSDEEVPPARKSKVRGPSSTEMSEGNEPPEWKKTRRKQRCKSAPPVLSMEEEERLKDMIERLSRPTIASSFRSTSKRKAKQHGTAGPSGIIVSRPRPGVRTPAKSKRVSVDHNPTVSHQRFSGTRKVTPSQLKNIVDRLSRTSFVAATAVASDNPADNASVTDRYWVSNHAISRRHFEWRSSNVQYVRHIESLERCRDNVSRRLNNYYI